MLTVYWAAVGPRAIKPKNSSNKILISCPINYKAVLFQAALGLGTDGDRFIGRPDREDISATSAPDLFTRTRHNVRA